MRSSRLQTEEGTETGLVLRHLGPPPLRGYCPRVPACATLEEAVSNQPSAGENLRDDLLNSRFAICCSLLADS